MTDDDIDEIRKRKMEELQRRAQREEQEAEQQERVERQKDALLKQHLDEGARRRLNTVKMTKPEFAAQAERQILALIKSGRLREKISEEQMKELLQEMQPDDDGFDIRRR